MIFGKRRATPKPILSKAERKRRKREAVISVIVVMVVALLTLAENQIVTFGAEIPVSNTILMFILININLLLLILLIFLVFRNLVKLLYARRRKVMGARLRTRLVMAFVALSLLPTIILFFFSINFITNSIEFWFNVPVELALENSLLVGQKIYRENEIRHRFFLERIAYQIERKNLFEAEKRTDLTHYIQGGRLVFEGRCEDLLPTAKPVSGTVQIRDYLLVHAPGLVKVLSMASFVGALGQLQRGGIHFRTLDGDLAFEDGIMTLANGRMEGVSLAMTAEGTYDIERRMTDLRGIVIPINVLNKVLDMIPVIGKIIVGDGIIATDYTIQGPDGDPEVNIRPLSTLSVGFLRGFIKEIDLQPIEKGELTAPDAPGMPQK